MRKKRIIRGSSGISRSAIAKVLVKMAKRIDWYLAMIASVAKSERVRVEGNSADRQARHCQGIATQPSRNQQPARNEEQPPGAVHEEEAQGAPTISECL
jgi:hypothetical protein